MLLKSMFISILIFLFIGCGSSSDSDGDISVDEISQTLPQAESLELFKQIKDEALDFQYQFAIDEGATFHTTPDKKSFYLEWYPDGVSASSNPPMFVSLHGSFGSVYASFYHFKAHAQEKGYGIIALQWWFGGDGGNGDYYPPSELYSIIDTILDAKGTKAHNTLLHGFSRASSNIYAVTAYDTHSKNNYFGMTIANSGKASLDYQPNIMIADGEFGDTPFDNTHWTMVCGMKDENPDRDGCVGMNETKDWVISYGGTVDLMIEDKDGDHLAFFTNPSNIEEAFDLFDELLKR